MKSLPSLSWPTALFVFLFPLILSLPFLNRAYFVDDNYFVEIAEWLAENPTQPYHFRADDAGLQNRGWEEDGFVRMVNPLFHHYLMAAIVQGVGAKEWVLRLGMVLITCFGALCVFGLARRFSPFPFLATLLVFATPAIWLTNHSLLIDSTMGTLFFGGIYLFIRGFEKDKLGIILFSGLLMGLALITKYTAALVLPLTGLWWLFNRKSLRRPGMAFFAWVLALSILVLWNAWTMVLYGAPHILAASARMVRAFGWTKYLIFLVFLSGVSIVPLISWLAVNRRVLIYSLGFLILTALFFASPAGGFTLWQGILISLWFLTSVLFLSNLWRDREKFRDLSDRFLLGWIGGFLIMMIFVMQWTAARYYYIAIPPIVFLSLRFLEIHQSHRAKTIAAGFLVGTLILSGSLAYADYRQAEPSRRVGAMLRSKGLEGGSGHFYLGDSFTMSYLKDEGWTPAFDSTKYQPGDLVLAKEVTMPPYWFFRGGINIVPIAVFEFPSSFPVRVMDYHGSAGFYASVWGALPFTFSQGPLERFVVYQVKGNP